MASHGKGQATRSLTAGLNDPNHEAPAVWVRVHSHTQTPPPSWRTHRDHGGRFDV